MLNNYNYSINCVNIAMLHLPSAMCACRTPIKSIYQYMYLSGIGDSTFPSYYLLFVTVPPFWSCWIRFNQFISSDHLL